MTKAEVISAMNEMSDSFLLDELIERLIVIEKVERAISSLGQGNGMQHNQVREEMKEYMRRTDIKDNFHSENAK